LLRLNRPLTAVFIQKKMAGGYPILNTLLNLLRSRCGATILVFNYAFNTGTNRTDSTYGGKYLGYEVVKVKTHPYYGRFRLAGLKVGQWLR